MLHTLSLLLLAGTLHAQPGAPAPQRTQGVWLDFREPDKAHGLVLAGGDLRSRKMTTIQGVPCVQTDPGNDALSLAFEASSEMILPDRDTLTFEVEVFDNGQFPVYLQFESAIATMPGAYYTRGAPVARRTGTESWRKFCWQVTDDAFADVSRNGIRFQLFDEGWWGDRILSVASVRVTHEAIPIRPEAWAVPCTTELPVTLEPSGPDGTPLPDGTELKLTYRPGFAFVDPPASVKVADGKASIRLKTGAAPMTAWIMAMAPGAKRWVGEAVHILESPGPLEVRDDLVLADSLLGKAYFLAQEVAESTIEGVTDGDGKPTIRGRFSCKPEGPKKDIKLVLEIPIAGLPQSLTVFAGSPEGSVNGLWAHIVDATGEIFPYQLHPRVGKSLDTYAEFTLDARGYHEGISYGTPKADGVIDLPCKFQCLLVTPLQGQEGAAEVQVWGVEVRVLAPPLGGQP